MLVALIPVTASYNSLVSEETDERGRARVMIRFGPTAGPGMIIVSVPALEMVDTAHFTVMTGAPAKVTILPNDTLLLIGRSVTLQAVVKDRTGNARSDPVSLTRISGPITLDGTTVSGTSEGVGRVKAEVSGVADTSVIAVLPPGPIAAGTPQGVVTFEADGSHRRLITVGYPENVRWAPDGAALAFDEGYRSPAKVVTIDGAVRPLATVEINSVAQMYPAFTNDNSTVFFSAVAGGAATFRLWRTTRNGSSPTLLSTTSPEDDFYPSPSPDGSRLAYVRRTGSGNDYIRILTVATGAVDKIDVRGHAPAWSPLGDRIAYVDLRSGGRLKTMLPDGTDQRDAGQQAGFELGVQWSPAAKYLIAYNRFLKAIQIVEVSTGLTINLPSTSDMLSPTWRP
jgi:hypothetical protein